MENNINIFNAISTLKMLAADNDAIKATLSVLEEEVKSMQVQYACTTGLNVLEQQQQARQEILNFLGVKTLTDKDEKEVRVPADIVRNWKNFIAGPLEDGHSVEIGSWLLSSYDKEARVFIKRWFNNNIRISVL